MVAPLNIQTFILSDVCNVVYTTLTLLETSHFVFNNITSIYYLFTSKKTFMSKPGTRRTYGSRQEYSIYAMSTAGTTLTVLQTKQIIESGVLPPLTPQTTHNHQPRGAGLYGQACADLHALASALNILPTMEHLKMGGGYC